MQEEIQITIGHKWERAMATLNMLKNFEVVYTGKSDFGNIAQGSQIFDVNQVHELMKPFLGQPYVWGGRNPAQGFDCSGLMEWSFAQIGINLYGTAETQYNKTVPVPEGKNNQGI